MTSQVTAASERYARIAGLPLTAGVPTLGDLWRRRELLGMLVRRDLRARYKNSSLGVLWSLIRPLILLLVYIFAVGQVLGAARSIPSFGLFVFTGLIVWTLFTEIVTGGTTSIVGNGGLITKVSLPREIFPLASVGGAVVNFGFQFVVLLAAMAISGEFPLTLRALWVLPGLALVLVFGAALAILLSALNVYLRDVQHLVEVVLIALFWLSPIVYSYSFLESLNLGWLTELYLANPVTLAVLAMQRGLWVAGAADPANWPADLGIRSLVAGAVCLVLLWVSHRVFRRLQGDFAQEL
ncbi:MAG: rfbA2 [Schumannella sp.]|nr:rfbA2 [Schumannella sp.]